MPLIKRYPNRKLYNTATKRYVSLAGIAELVRQGAAVQVVDHATGEDITSVTLMAVILDNEKKGGGSVPSPVLTELVQAGEDTLAALRRALASPGDLWREVDAEIERRIQRLVKLGEVGEAEGLRLRDQLLALGQKACGALPDEGAIRQFVARHSFPARAEVQSLSERLAALEAEVEALSKAQAPQEASPQPRPRASARSDDFSRRRQR